MSLMVTGVLLIFGFNQLAKAHDCEEFTLTHGYWLQDDGTNTKCVTITTEKSDATCIASVLLCAYYDCSHGYHNTFYGKLVK